MPPARSLAPALALQGLSHHYGAHAAVDGADLSLPSGVFMALLGPSGCGKTTLLRLVAGFERPASGTISIGERAVVTENGASLPPEQRSVGMVFQDYALFPHLSVEQNVGYGLGRDPGRPARVRELLALVGLAGLERQQPHQLSGGQQQRVALARALAPRPALMLLDEPFSNLDASLRQSVRAEVRRILAQTGVSTLFVTHDQAEALSMADLVAVMIGGRIVQVAPPRELYERPLSQTVAAFVGGANFVPGTADGTSVECALGRLPLARPAFGPVVALVRPELLELTAVADGPLTVVERSYFGADQLLTLRLPDGLPLHARVPPWQEFASGDRALATVRGPVVAFARG